MIHFLPDSVIERECLEQFAALTRHDAGALKHGFVCTFGESDGDKVINLKFGGARKASRTIPSADLLDSLNDFAKKHAIPLALELLESGKPS